MGTYCVIHGHDVLEQAKLVIREGVEREQGGLLDDKDMLCDLGGGQVYTTV